MAGRRGVAEGGPKFAQGGAERQIREGGQELVGSSASTPQMERDDMAEAGFLRLGIRDQQLPGELMVGVRGQSWVIDVADGGVPVSQLSDGGGVATGSLDPDSERSEASLCQPAIKGTGGKAPG